MKPLRSELAEGRVRSEQAYRVERSKSGVTVATPLSNRFVVKVKYISTSHVAIASESNHRVKEFLQDSSFKLFKNAQTLDV